MQGEVQVVKLLLSERGVDPNQLDAYGVAPLHKAVSFGHVTVVQHLLSDRRVRPRCLHASHAFLSCFLLRSSYMASGA